MYKMLSKKCENYPLNKSQSTKANSTGVPKLGNSYHSKLQSRYTEAAAAAACAATAAYNQHMARCRAVGSRGKNLCQKNREFFGMRFAAQAAAAYPQFSIMPPFLPSLKMEADTDDVFLKI